MNAKLNLWRLAASVCLFAGVACAAQGQSKPVAVVNGENITEADVQKAAAPELEKLDQKQKQFTLTLERDRKSAVEDALDLTPALRRHAPSSACLSHARAIAHCRFTVAGETPTASAVSSTVRPPK